MMFSKPFQQAAAFGAVLAAGPYAPAEAALLDYSFQGSVLGASGVSGYNGHAFSANAEVNTATGAVGPFSFSVAGVGTWTGTGGTASFTGTNFFLNWNGAQYLSIPAANAFTPARAGLFWSNTNPQAFGGFVDGFPTTFNLPSTVSLSGLFETANSGSRFFVQLDSGSVTVASVPVPAAVPLLGSGLSGLAALAARRRRKTAAA